MRNTATLSPAAHSVISTKARRASAGRSPRPEKSSIAEARSLRSALRAPVETTERAARLDDRATASMLVDPYGTKTYREDLHAWPQPGCPAAEGIPAARQGTERAQGRQGRPARADRGESRIRRQGRGGQRSMQSAPRISCSKAALSNRRGPRMTTFPPIDVPPWSSTTSGNSAGFPACRSRTGPSHRQNPVPTAKSAAFRTV